MQTINTQAHRLTATTTAEGVYVPGNCGPIVKIKHIERHVHGNGIGIHVWGEMKIAAGEIVYARELKLNTIKVLNLTPVQPYHTGVGYIPQKHIFNQGAYDNYASIEVYDDASNFLGPGSGPEDGSIWLDFEGFGE